MLLELRNLHVHYGNIEVLHGIDVYVKEGEIVTILGANGAGKSTTLMSVSGLVRPSAGGIWFEGRPLHELPSHEVVHLGITQAPEGRRIFGTLTVQENLELGAFTRNDSKAVRETLHWIFDLFPRLLERQKQLAGTLSGGEQQMLAIGRALMSRPRVLLLDEPSLGLSPIMVRAILDTARTINQSGVTIVLVEQNARAALKIATRGYVMELGRMVMENTAQNLLNDPEVQNTYLGGSSES